MTTNDRAPDRAARATAARLLRAYVAGEITNDDMVDGWPRQVHDEAIDGIFNVVWYTYSDLQTHKFEGATPELRALFERAAQFLDADRPYPWPKISWLVRLASLPTFGLLERLVYRRVLRAVNEDYWPYASPSDVPPGIQGPPIPPST